MGKRENTATATKFVMTMALNFPSKCFPTEIIKSHVVAGFVFTETSYAPNQRLPRHSHEYACFVIVLQGAFVETYGKKVRSCAPSSVIFRPPDEVHSDHFYDRGGRCLTVEIAPRWLERAREHSISLNDSAQFHNGLLTTITMRLYREFCEMDNVSQLAIEGLILETIAEFSRCSVKASDLHFARRIEQAKEIIHDQFSGSLTLARVAEVIGTHPVYLAREFRKRYRCTVGEYIRRLRIQAACRELSSSDAQLAEVALICGFSDQSHFSRVFKRLTGMTPSQYRANLRSR